ncbi:M15 family metallopeptidase [Paenibacillus aestuarii]|uniref:M15 family metallopeptidase n=1 Tax=Paenibacillus aestuarii TaxID=516965 RepID=A0ABW0KGU1_9BACL|nr:M15 family metallopeptidase [Paenibacillus aestuarii]
MKKWGILLVVCLLSGCGWLQQAPESMVDVTVTQNVSSSHSAATKTIQVSKDQIYKGSLILINKNYAVHPESVEPDIVKLSQHKELLKGFGLLDQSIQLPRSLVQQFATMVEAAGKGGVSHFLISSGYRSNKEQSKLYQEEGADYALPAGYSEHNLGLALDIGSSLKAMNEAPEGEWLQKHAADYGFILRYPKDKTVITGIQYEPWHFRYVGLPHSVIMQSQHLTLEEYLDYLKRNKTIRATVGGDTYEITYNAIAQVAKLEVPADHRYELSGDNMNGVIVTVQL